MDNFDPYYLEIGFLGLGGGMLLSGVCWILGLIYSLCINLISKTK